ncbi:hypothetical protein AB1N83_007162, partial [Pleurotus pulmonarius]
TARRRTDATSTTQASSYL